jgi:beta-lactamase superfamily II metal-dependent hydrolase
MIRQEISVSMFNVGFGDAFVVRVPDDDGGTRTLLIDCGVHNKGVRRDCPISEVVTRVLDSVRGPSGEPTIDVVVASHRHADHISGFADERWADVRVGEVWMPWTEDPDDGQAVALTNARMELASRLQARLNAEADRRPLARVGLGMLDELLAASNSSAMETLREGFLPLPGKRSVRRRYLSSRNRPRTIPGVEGLRIHVLGPSRDEGSLRKPDPSVRRQYMTAPAATGDDLDAPFAARFRCDESTESAMSRLLTAEEREEFAALADDPEGVAAELQCAGNDSSLILAIEMGQAVLVFPGDAEWRSWDAVLADPGARALLSRASLLKVAHHGSCNATPVKLVEEVLPTRMRWALVSTQAERPFETIPREPLLAALRRRGFHVLRSDGVDLPPGEGRSYWKKDGGDVYEVRVKI